MAADDKPPEGFSLKRWSRRKLEAKREAAAAETPAPAPSVSNPLAQPPAATAAGAPSATPAAGAPALPPIEGLTSESDFAAFMHPKVEEGLRRQALKKLFADPHFNVMDGLDVYIDDYSKPDPVSPDVLERLTQMGFVRDAGAAPREEARPEASSPPEAPTPVAPEAASGAAASEPVPAPTPAAPGSHTQAAVGPPAGDDSSEPRSR